MPKKEQSFYKFERLLASEVPRGEGPFKIEKYLDHFIKEGAEIPFFRAKFVFEYSPWPSYSRIFSKIFSNSRIYPSGNIESGIYLDSYFNIFLVVSRFQEGSDTYFPIALISFDIEEDSDTVVIWQIQGVKGAVQFLKPIRWEKMLVKVIVNWAKEHNFRNVEIADVEELRFYPQKYNRDSPLEWWEEELAKRMKFRYTVTAKRLGFKFNKSRKRWIKKLY